MPKIAFSLGEEKEKSTSLSVLGTNISEISLCLDEEDLDESIENKDINGKLRMEIEDEKPASSKGFLEVKKNAIMQAPKLNYEYTEQMRNDFRSMYVLNFVQNDNIFDFFKSIMSMNTESSDDYPKKSKKANVKMCKYIHMIIQNPINKEESYELGLKVIDIVPSMTNSH